MIPFVREFWGTYVKICVSFNDSVVATRSNPTVTRKALINIARKKQTRGMTTAWKKLKEKMGKEESGQKGQKKSKPAAPPSDLKDWVDKTKEKLAAIDPSAWSDAEKADFVASLTELKKTILTLVKK